VNDPKHYLKHRERLRQRFLKGDERAIADYELLELLLFQALPRKDVKPLAKDLLRQFGSFAAVITAEPEELRRVEGLGDAAVATFKVVRSAAIKLTREKIPNRPIIGAWQQLIDYIHANMAHLKIEHLRILFLDNRNRLIADEEQQTGTVNHTPVYPREVIRRALDLGASAIILVHNHPSGDPAPSKADIEMTREVARAGEALGVAVHDHLIIGHNGHASFKSLGLL
jgi:DNA repair protein RadC